MRPALDSHNSNKSHTEICRFRVHVVYIYMYNTCLVPWLSPSLSCWTARGECVAGPCCRGLLSFSSGLRPSGLWPATEGLRHGAAGPSARQGWWSQPERGRQQQARRCCEELGCHCGSVCVWWGGGTVLILNFVENNNDRTSIGWEWTCWYSIYGVTSQ